MDPLSLVILICVTLQRIGELFYGRSNEQRLRTRGAIEFGAKHYPMIVALHAFWLIGLWILALDRPANLVWLGVFIILQILRFWVLLSLRERWTTRILVLPDAPLVRSGPYRYFAHPNYAVVIGELFALPMVFGLLWYAILFSVLNAIVLTVRIGVEAHALRDNAGASAKASNHSS